MLQSDKPTPRALAHIAASKGIRHVIISPGSRNAPLSITLNEHGGFLCMSVPDERSAAFVALGIAQQTRIPAIICCTSGSASLNYAPAVAEAYHQGVPMLIVTADRPTEWIGQGEGQSIKQQNIYENYIKKSYHLHLDNMDGDHLWSNVRMLNEAIDLALLHGLPVHVNMPFREPLYNKVGGGERLAVPVSTIYPVEKHLAEAILADAARRFFNEKKILVLAGLLPNTEEDWTPILKKLSRRAVILAECTSNWKSDAIYNNVDALLCGIGGGDDAFRPDLLITVGHSFVSKKVKQWLRGSRPGEHWHISDTETAQDVFQSLTRHYPVRPHYFFGKLLAQALGGGDTSSYLQCWQRRAAAVQAEHEAFAQNAPWSDWRAFARILPMLPVDCNLQLGNSSIIRYAQLFPLREKTYYNGNRGVSGIDGPASTALGAAWAQARPVIHITGDIAFLYDSNALWNAHLPANFRIIIINNNGGGIFRLIPGPSDTNQLSRFFEATHDHDIEGIAKAFGIPYYGAVDETELSEVMPRFLSSQVDSKPAILEVRTPRGMNDRVFKQYHQAIRL